MRKLLLKHTWLNLKLIFSRAGSSRWVKLLLEIEELEKKLNYPKL